jgi:hypothetical protein
MPSKDVTKLEKKLEMLESRLKSGVRSKSAVGTVKLDKLDKQNLRREIKDIKAKLNSENNRVGKKGNTLGHSLDGEIGEPGTTMPPAGKKAKDKDKASSSSASKKASSSPASKEDKPKLVKRKGPSYSDDMTQNDYGLREKVRIRDKAKEENIGEAAAEANLKKGGTVRKSKPAKYSMKHGGFTKRGGMYKKGMS